LPGSSKHFSFGSAKVTTLQLNNNFPVQVKIHPRLLAQEPVSVGISSKWSNKPFAAHHAVVQ